VNYPNLEYSFYVKFLLLFHFLPCQYILSKPDFNIFNRLC
jgi:hypothetical protein